MGTEESLKVFAFLVRNNGCEMRALSKWMSQVSVSGVFILFEKFPSLVQLTHFRNKWNRYCFHGVIVFTMSKEIGFN